MARVSLHFEDADGGLVDFRADYKIGYEANSHAHRLANQVIHFLEREAVEKVIAPQTKERITTGVDLGILDVNGVPTGTRHG